MKAICGAKPYISASDQSHDHTTTEGLSLVSRLVMMCMNECISGFPAGCMGNVPLQKGSSSPLTYHSCLPFDGFIPHISGRGHEKNHQSLATVHGEQINYQGDVSEIMISASALSMDPHHHGLNLSSYIGWECSPLNP